jgi:hypothetical protein
MKPTTKLPSARSEIPASVASGSAPITEGVNGPQPAVDRGAGTFCAAVQGRQSSAAIAASLARLDADLTKRARQTEDIRIEALWLLRAAEPARTRAGCGHAVATTAGDFSTLAGRLYSTLRVCTSLQEHIEPLLAELVDGSVLRSAGRGTVDRGADRVCGEQ